MNPSDVRFTAEDEKDWRIETLEHTASWHEIKAEMYLDDRHKASCAQSLFELAEVIRAFPLAHPLFGKLAKVDHLYELLSNVVFNRMNQAAA